MGKPAQGWLPLAIAILVAASCGGRGEPRPAPAVTEAMTSHRAVEVRWEKEWDEAFARARREGRPVLVNFSAEWCVWCKHLESVTFRDAKVAALLGGQVVPLAVDIDRADQELLRRHRIEAPPTILVLDTDGHELGRIPGYLPPGSFLEVVESFLPPATT